MSEPDARQPSVARAPMRVSENGASVGALLTRMRSSAFQGRKLGEAFEAWKRMIDGPSLICLGLAGSLSSAGMWPLVTWLIERGYVDLIASTCANVTEDVLEVRGATLQQVDPEHVDDSELWRTGRYRFYDHVVSAKEYDAMETFTADFFRHLASSWKHASISGARFMLEYGRWLGAQGAEDCIAAACARHGVPLFVPAAHDGPLAEGYRESGVRGPAVDFFRDYDIALALMERSMAPGRGTVAIFLGGGVPKDFIQITATSVCAIRGGEASPHRAAIQITTDNTVYGGLGGASVASECISWGKEAADGVNVMCFADVTIALPLLCEGLAEHYGPTHRRRAGRVGAAFTDILEA
ncbi:MAG TPA: deoxyhypusine synthase family protein [Methylomirabilota bacterium]|nr:deoxyhypusine synthase family protein [Methylomirabilota bacterium]